MTEGVHLENLALNERIILKWFLKKSDSGMKWIDMAQNMDRWCAFVYVMMNLRFL
jgi:hypothetical protein